jgi:hypothetical protein
VACRQPRTSLGRLAASKCGDNSVHFLTETIDHQTYQYLGAIDGDPIRNAAVMFVPVDGGRPSTGRTDAEGRFELSTIVPGDGTAPGEYAVTITACESLVPEDEAGPVTDEDYENEQIRWIVPQRYSRAETSGLTADVGRKNHEFPFELETAEGQERRTRSPASDG